MQMSRRFAAFSGRCRPASWVLISAPVRQLFPEAIDPVEPLDVYREVPVVEGRPAVRLNMIVSVDGASSVDGLSGGLGGAADRKVFAALRSLADVVLVAAGTMR